MLDSTDRPAMIGVAKRFDRLKNTLQAVQAWRPDQACASSMQDVSIAHAPLSESLRGPPLSFPHNQAGAAQVIAIDNQIGSDITRLNVIRGAIARGPPFDLSDL